MHYAGLVLTDVMSV